MTTTIDAGGRIVIPKAIRDELGLTAGSEVDISFDGYTIHIDRVPPPAPEIIDEDGFLVLKPADRRPITDEDVRSIRDATQR